jgi:tetratricopeptide (TPR) repeat protein
MTMTTQRPGQLLRTPSSRPLNPVRGAPGSNAGHALRSRASLRAVVVALATFAFAGGIAPHAVAQAAPVADTLAGNYLAGRFANNQADLGASARFFAEALASDPEDPYLLERALALSLGAGEIEDGVELAERLAGVDSGNRLAALALGIDAILKKNWAVAADTLKTANAGPLAGLTVEVLSAWAEAGSGKVDQALARLDALEGEAWFAFFRSYHAGLIASVAGRDAEATRRLRQAHDMDDGAVRVLEALIRSLGREGKFDEARKIMAAAEERVPDHPLLRTVGADLDAERKPKPMVSTVHQGAAEILAGLGSAIARDDTGELAAVYLQFALALDPRADLARITLAEIFERSRQYEKAIELLDGVSPNSPLKRNAEIQIGFDYNALDKVDEAREHLGALVEQNPGDLEAVMALGNVLRVRKMFEEAAEIYTAGIDSLEAPETQHWTLFYNRGIAYERTDRWPLAEADFRKALELRPDQPLVLNYLGYSWVDKGMNYDEALGMIEKAVELEPSDGYIIDSLGWVYYKLGRYEEAVEQLERAVSLRAEDPTINDHLGDAYWKVGRKLEARFQWSHARDRNPEPADLEKILDKLANGLVDDGAPAAADASGAPPATPAPAPP